MVGALLLAERTLTLNTGSITSAPPSLTLIRIFAKTPRFALVGRPDNVPVAVFKLAQVGPIAARKAESAGPVGDGGCEAVCLPGRNRRCRCPRDPRRRPGGNHRQ